MAGLIYLPCLALALVLLVLALLKAFGAIGKAYFSPLASIPSPNAFAPLSRLFWVFPQEVSGNVTLELPRLHEKLGPLVRIGPNEVSFYSLESYNTVHKVGSGFAKDPRTYGEFVQGDHPALFSITDKEEHAKRRRLMGQVYNRSKMDQLHDLMLSEIDHFVGALKARSPRTLDTVPACRALESDIISRFSFGTSIGAISCWKQGRDLGMVRKNDEKATWMPILTSFPGLCSLWESMEQYLHRWTGWQTEYTSCMKEWEAWATSNLERILSQTEPEKSTLPNLIRTLLRSGLHPQTALCEARENIGPGTDTTSATLAHILWALAHNPDFQAELRQDLARTKFPTDMTALENLPKLRACVKEGIRWAGAASAMLPRVTPAGGAMLDGIHIPEGTVVTSSPIWYLRDKTAFPNPEYYNPFRWLTPDGVSFDENNPAGQYYVPFSKGSNVCMGAHFSYYELFLSVSQMVKHFRIRLPREAIKSSPFLSGADLGRFNPVPLPPRKEWVAAVVTQPLEVVLDLI